MSSTLETSRSFCFWQMCWHSDFTSWVMLDAPELKATNVYVMVLAGHNVTPTLSTHWSELRGKLSAAAGLN